MSLLTEDIKAELASMVTLCDDGEAVPLEVADIPKPLGEIVAAIAKGVESTTILEMGSETCPAGALGLEPASDCAEALTDPELVYDGASLKDSLKKYGMDSITNEVPLHHKILTVGNDNLTQHGRLAIANTDSPDPECDSTNHGPMIPIGSNRRSLQPALSMAQMMNVMNSQRAIAERNSTNAKMKPPTKAELKSKSKNKMAKKSRAANRR